MIKSNQETFLQEVDALLGLLETYRDGNIPFKIVSNQVNKVKKAANDANLKQKKDSREWYGV